jgi:hypothetical protein
MRNFRYGFNPISIVGQRLHGTGCKRLAFPPIATAVSDKLSQFLRWLFRVPGKKRTPYGAMLPRWEIDLGGLVLG